MPKALMLAFSDPTSDDVEDDYNSWYSDKHIWDLLDIEGFISATRYRMPHGIETLPGVGTEQHSYLAVYEIEAEDEAGLQRFADALKEALSDGTADISPKLDMGTISSAFCLPITDRVSHDSVKA